MNHLMRGIYTEPRREDYCLISERPIDEEPNEEPYIDPYESLEDIAEKERELRGGGHCPDCGDPLCYGNCN